jgi:hypothetical protein
MCGLCRFVATAVVALDPPMAVLWIGSPRPRALPLRDLFASVARKALGDSMSPSMTVGVASPLVARSTWSTLNASADSRQADAERLRVSPRANVAPFTPAYQQVAHLSSTR